ncbi:MAG: SDR family oxidoreductase [Polyangiales bacterium]
MPAILIVGANRGLGLEFARQYLDAGYRVFATAREPERAKELRQLAEQKPQLSVHALEATDATSVATLARELAKEPLDIVLHNAGVMGSLDDKIGKINYAGMLQTLEINTIAPLRVAEAFLPNLERGKQKLVAALTSGMGSIAETGGGYYAYRASKAALNMTIRNFAIEVRDRGVIAVVINPGWVQTDMGGASATLKPHESISAMRKVFAGLTAADSGTFLDYKGGTLPW